MKNHKTVLLKTFKTDVTVIIRSVQERTEAVCKKLVLEQGVEETNLFVVREIPFSAAMKKSFKIGLESGKKWTLCLDADVLLRPDSIRNMVHFAEMQETNVCEVQGLVLDKFFSEPREAGNHLYRTSLLELVLQKIPEEGTDIRPEGYTLRKMNEAGYPYVKMPYVLGTHDDEQYNEDIYRKAYVQTVKHLDRAECLVTNWKENYETDPDFHVALKAFSDSILNMEKVYINSDQKLYKEMFKASGFGEKPPLDANNISAEYIENQINDWGVEEKYRIYSPNRYRFKNRVKTAIKKFGKSWQNRGFIKTIIRSFGRLFIRVGRALNRLG